MKKLFVLTMALMAICLTAQAQLGRNWTNASQSSFQNVINRMQPVGTSYAITPTPITILEYYNICWGGTNTPLMSEQEKLDGVNAIKAVSEGFGPNESGTFCSAVKHHFDNWKNPYFKVATKAQIKEGHRKVGLHGERSHASTQTRGFYVVMSYSDWQRLKTN